MKNRYIGPLAFVIIAMILTDASPLANANAYRWVDEKGQVHYSDHMPPQDVDKAYAVINKEGITINNVEKAKTKEQLTEEQRLQQQRIEKEQLARDRANYEHILLDTYTQVSDLEETRERYIATLEGLVQVAQHKLANLNHDLDKLRQSTASLAREGKTVPEYMGKDITNLQSQVERENNFILAQRSQQSAVREKFSADIKRYNELKLEQQSAK